MSKLTLAQQAQVVKMLTTTYVCGYDLQGIYNVYCNTGILTDMLSADDRAYFDEQDIDIYSDDFDIFAHGELSFTELLEKLKAIGDIEEVASYAWPMYNELKAQDGLRIQQIG